MHIALVKFAMLFTGKKFIAANNNNIAEISYTSFKYCICITENTELNVLTTNDVAAQGVIYLTKSDAPLHLLPNTIGIILGIKK